MNDMAQPSANPSTDAASYVDAYSPSTPASSAPVAPTATPAPAPVAQPAAPVTQPAAPQPATSKSAVSQALEDQNVFTLLGVDTATEDEKEAFLDELQQVIWEDFLENDVELLVTEEEMVDLKKIIDKPATDELQQQEEIITFLEKLVPDLEEIMLEKALELKADMVRERIQAMRSYYTKPEDAAKITQAEDLMKDDQWREVAELLNSIHD